MHFMDLNLNHRDCFGDSSLASWQRGVRWRENISRGLGSRIVVRDADDSDGGLSGLKIDAARYQVP